MLGYQLYNLMIEQLRAVIPELEVYPRVVITNNVFAGRFMVHQDQLTAYLHRWDRDEEWAYTVRTALDGIQSLIFRDFDSAEAAFRSVLEQCGIEVA